MISRNRLLFLLICLLAGVAASASYFYVKGDLDFNKSERRAKQDIKEIEAAVLEHQLKYNRLPEQLFMLHVGDRHEPYFKYNGSLFDPWGNQYLYEPQNVHPRTGIPLIYSSGPSGTKKRITNWD